MAYAKKRELDKKTIDHFGIGYAPQQENLLLLYLRGKNYQYGQNLQLVQHSLEKLDCLYTLKTCRHFHLCHIQSIKNVN